MPKFNSQKAQLIIMHPPYMDIVKFTKVVGDVYKNSKVFLGFYTMDMIKRNFDVKLKGIIIKNIEGNRGKLGSGGIWRYRGIE